MVDLTRPQREMLAKVPDDWAEMPAGVGCTNKTACALEKRGALEMRLKPDEIRVMFYSRWQWRKKPVAHDDISRGDE